MKPQSPSTDLHNEQLVPLSDVPGLLPRRRGKKVHYQTVYRWTTKGAGGHRLDSVKVGRIRYTSVEALRRFTAGRAAPPGRDAFQQAVEDNLRRAGL